MAIQLVRPWYEESGGPNNPGHASGSVSFSYASTPAQAGSMLVAYLAYRPAVTSEIPMFTVEDNLGGTWVQVTDALGDPLVAGGKTQSTKCTAFARLDAEGVTAINVTASTPGGGYIIALIFEFTGGPTGGLAEWVAKEYLLPSATSWEPQDLEGVPAGSLFVAGASLGVTNRTMDSVAPFTLAGAYKGSSTYNIAAWAEADGSDPATGPAYQLQAGDSSSSVTHLLAAVVGASGPQALTVSVDADTTMSADETLPVAAVAAGGSGTREYQWTVQSGPGGAFGNEDSASTIFDPSGVPGVYVLRCTVTDSTGTAHDELTLTVLRSLTSLPMAALNTADSWTPTGPAALAAVSDSDDSTAITSPEDPTDAVLDFTAPPLAVPDQPFVARIRARHRDATTGTVTGHLYVGDTLHSTSDPADITDTYEWVDLTFPLVDLGGITEADWQAGVRVTYTITAS